ncbi:unnamed protein product [Meloidogyne enterolobii]|uniref:Uncharacterized protein n=1 Tax=Meloidogyne enterolobii TaxID=390850 RepID=A0ACB0YTH6_MELEN
MRNCRFQIVLIKCQLSRLQILFVFVSAQIVNTSIGMFTIVTSFYFNYFFIYLFILKIIKLISLLIFLLKNLFKINYFFFFYLINK